MSIFKRINTQKKKKKKKRNDANPLKTKQIRNRADPERFQSGSGAVENAEVQRKLGEESACLCMLLMKTLENESIELDVN